MLINWVHQIFGCVAGESVVACVEMLEQLLETSPCGSSPKTLGDLERVDTEILPPADLITSLMQLSMMTATKWNSELVADFQTD